MENSLFLGSFFSLHKQNQEKHYKDFLFKAGSSVYKVSYPCSGSTYSSVSTYMYANNDREAPQLTW